MSDEKKPVEKKPEDVVKPKKKGFWSRVLDVVGEAMGEAWGNR